MDWLKRLFGKKIVLGVGQTSTFDPALGKVYNLRRGMWVVVRNSGRPVGIITDLFSDASARVMLVNGRGENKIEVDVPANTLQQASLQDIPTPRRPPKGLATALGYPEKPR